MIILHCLTYRDKIKCNESCNHFSGTDMEPGKEGGTWLALSMKGKAAIILNLITPEGVTNSPKKGRGSLITNFVTSNDSMESYLSKLHTENSNGQPYNPYCLVLLDLRYAKNNNHIVCVALYSAKVQTYGIVFIFSVKQIYII